MSTQGTRRRLMALFGAAGLSAAIRPAIAMQSGPETRWCESGTVGEWSWRIEMWTNGSGCRLVLYSTDLNVDWKPAPARTLTGPLPPVAPKKPQPGSLPRTKAPPEWALRTTGVQVIADFDNENTNRPTQFQFWLNPPQTPLPGSSSAMAFGDNTTHGYVMTVSTKGGQMCTDLRRWGVMNYNRVAADAWNVVCGTEETIALRRIIGVIKTEARLDFGLTYAVDARRTPVLVGKCELHGISAAWRSARNAWRRERKRIATGEDVCTTHPLSGCFLTTATCAAVGLDDDCWELRQLRSFRDQWLANRPGGFVQIAEYYDLAPGILATIQTKPNARRQLLRIYWMTIVPCALLIRMGFSSLAHRKYMRMMSNLARHQLRRV